MSEAIITCKEPVRAVIELNAGQVSRHKIQLGDTVKHTAFDELVSLRDISKRPVPSPKSSTDSSEASTTEEEPKAINPNGPVIPKGPKAINPNGPVIPKGPKAIATQPQPIVPIEPAM